MLRYSQTLDAINLGAIIAAVNTEPPRCAIARRRLGQGIRISVSRRKPPSRPRSLSSSRSKNVNARRPSERRNKNYR